MLTGDLDDKQETWKEDLRCSGKESVYVTVTLMRSDTDVRVMQAVLMRECRCRESVSGDDQQQVWWWL